MAGRMFVHDEQATAAVGTGPWARATVRRPLGAIRRSGCRLRSSSPLGVMLVDKEPPCADARCPLRGRPALPSTLSLAMPARSIGTATISFGLVSVPVNLYLVVRIQGERVVQHAAQEVRRAPQAAVHLPEGQRRVVDARRDGQGIRVRQGPVRDSLSRGAQGARGEGDEHDRHHRVRPARAGATASTSRKSTTSAPDKGGDRAYRLLDRSTDGDGPRRARAVRRARPAAPRAASARSTACWSWSSSTTPTKSPDERSAAARRRGEGAASSRSRSSSSSRRRTTRSSPRSTRTPCASACWRRSSARSRARTSRPTRRRTAAGRSST